LDIGANIGENEEKEGEDFNPLKSGKIFKRKKRTA